MRLWFTAAVKLQDLRSKSPTQLEIQYNLVVNAPQIIGCVLQHDEGERFETEEGFYKRDVS